MRGSQRDIQRVLDGSGVIAARDHPELRGAIEWLVRTRQLASVLPGVYAPPDQIAQPMTRMIAVSRWDPDAILTHEAAAALSFWPELAVPVVRCQVRHARVARPGFAFTRGRIPPELVWQRGPLKLTVPELTALDLTDGLGGDAIDRVLRTRTTTLSRLQRALELTPSRPGNRERWALLSDSRDEPWSQAERRFHRLLRAAGITGWRANRPVECQGETFYVDVKFRRLKLAIEIDGWEFHNSREVFESDRRRQDLLVINGWRVLRFTWRMVADEPEWVISVLRTAMQQK